MKESIVDGCKIGGVIVISSIGFDSDEGDGVFFDEDALGFASLIPRQYLLFFFLFFLFFLLLFFLFDFFFALLFFFGLFFFFTLLGLSIIFLDESLGFQLCDDVGDERVVEAFSELFESNVESFIDHFEVLPRDSTYHLPSLNTLLVISLQSDHCFLRQLFEGWIRVKSCSCLLVILIKIFNVGLICLVVRICFLHIGDQHSELSSPISHMVGPHYVETHKLKDSANRLSNNSASQMPYVHFLGNIWRRKVHNNLLLLDFRE